MRFRGGRGGLITLSGTGSQAQGAPAIPTNPREISGLTMSVFDSENTSYTDAAKTTNPSDTNVIRVWEDETIGQDFTVPAGSAQPVFNATATGGNIDFDGANDYLTSGNTTLNDFDRLDPFSVFCVVQFDTLSTTTIIAAKNDRIASQARGWLFYASTNSMFMEFNNTVGSGNRIVVEWTNSIAAATPYYFVLTYSGSSASSGFALRRNAVLQTFSSIVDALSATTLNGSEFNIGNRDNGSGNEALNGKLAEVVIWNKELSSEEITIVESYAATTYSI